MKKIDNNIFARSFKWVFLTLVLTAITSDKLFAQEKQNDTKSPGIVIQLGEEKQILSRQDSICITSICSPKIYEKIAKLSNAQDSLQNELLKNRETVKHINKWSYGVDITTTLKEYSDQEKKIIKTMAKNYKAISKHLSKCFKRNISNPNAIKVYENKNTGKITVQGYSKHKKGEIFFVSPGTSNIAKETTYQYKQNSR